jgi:hypothetical protein
MLDSRIRHSIGRKIFVAFFAMAVVIVALGVYGYGVLASAGNMVTGTYDGPLMAINYARAASVDFVQMQQSVLERRYSPVVARPRLEKKIDDLTSAFFPISTWRKAAWMPETSWKLCAKSAPWSRAGAGIGSRVNAPAAIRILPYSTPGSLPVSTGL